MLWYCKYYPSVLLVGSTLGVVIVVLGALQSGTTLGGTSPVATTALSPCSNSLTCIVASGNNGTARSCGLSSSFGRRDDLISGLCGRNGGRGYSRAASLGGTPLVLLREVVPPVSQHPAVKVGDFHRGAGKHNELGDTGGGPICLSQYVFKN